MYNVRIKHFLDSTQIQVFEKANYSPGELHKDKQFNISTGEIIPIDNKIKEYNPFTEKVEYIPKFDDDYTIYKSYTRTKNTVYDIVRSNNWSLFVTLTFNPDIVDSFDYQNCSKKLTSWLNHLRRICPDFVYVVVPEQHKSGRWHFHGLFANCDNMDLIPSGKTDASGRCIYNIGNYKFGFTTATFVDNVAKTCSYLLKYITKDLCSVTFNKKRYWCSRNCKRPIIEDKIIEGNYIEKIKQVSSDSIGYIKRVENNFNSVTYIEINK